MHPQFTKFFSDYPIDDRWVYLGSAKNPSSQMKYDFYIVDNESYAAVHSNIAGDYGSGKIEYDNCFLNQQMTASMSKDFIWGIYQAKFLALYYLAFNKSPWNPE